ncbi:sugar ABC transporter ATP-binding protein [Clostridium botulinum C]|uniref:Sugar ABC transporter ATP-binding protein n=2 Tax=Clostridium botulinum TaxID=1491 RepID=A0A9Q4TLP2_CLOBO|nr:sugar ABC transporter ATP-binding protein [Clostridium botulinum]MCD3195644.1 sugar ABC transporter ATP-binding protein [Clostridium botulinum C]MCD3201059.1 sugar ABC transporter ATP-binding protein [Clostridium botulinum C]MCD3206499.1 sugar ABC transporter ATP-binding protein [Clostridium botulinum C]MCD3208974.1 sugar ABC transporter ATP-binding protein [Clostridium botulinum C]MCD3225639.1 sugar ABC transporter ATP-binding protein [Clostridium botulinum C]
MNKRHPMLKMKGISKSFAGVKALQNIDIEVYGGEVLALLGENGAGKSTLMKILSGVYKKDSGKIFIEGEEVSPHNIKEAEKLGVSIIHQELSVLPNLTVAENIFLGNEKYSKFTRKINKTLIRERSKMFLEQIGCKVNPDSLVRDVNVGDRQMIEIAKALTKNSRIIIMDEPTTALTDVETKKLFEVIDKLKKKGIAIIYISHRMEELFAICDRVTVLRDGQYVGDVRTSEIDQDGLIAMMVGRKLEDQFPYKKVKVGKTLLKVENLKYKNKVNDVSFEIKSGEILGVAGLMGSGRTELTKTIFGEYKKEDGNVFLEDVKVNITSPGDGIKNGICYVSEDRKGEGLILGMSVGENMSLANLASYENKLKKIDKKMEKEQIREYIKKLSVKTPSAEQFIYKLSGGNQQKAILAKWIMLSPKILIIDEPTKGIDVGAKKEIYEVLNELKSSGKAIIMISSDMPEVLGISDRIIVMHEGKISGELSHKEASQEAIMAYAVGRNK